MAAQKLNKAESDSAKVKSASGGKLNETQRAPDFLQNHVPNEVKTLLSWTAPGRPFKKRTKQYYLTSLLIMLFVEVILFLFSQYMLMLVVLSLVFVAFALATVPPRDFHYRISTEGITVEDHFFLWQELYDFYFKKRNGIDILHVRTHAFIPGELTITLGDISEEHVKSVLLPFLPYREYIKPTFMDKSADWLSKNFPLEGV
ncbi:MAG: hypothetical protein M1405_00110 [Patescibacteria group bacterium]|nr:hypothetical protein [Patescibacteria group bacterium]